ncbi:MAG: hypothetical protein ACRD2W_23995 [Acidimicrobiales bacterium]
MTAAPGTFPTAPFEASRARVEEMLAWLEGDEAGALTHAELEGSVEAKGREVLRQSFQDHLGLRAQREQRGEVVDAHGVARRRVEAGHRRPLATVFGGVGVGRLAYRRPGHANLHPADGVLNLPVERHSHGLRRLAAIESSRGSFDGAVEAIERATGSHVSPSARWSSSPGAPRPTSRASTPPSSGSRPPTATCWSSPSTARAS